MVSGFLIFEFFRDEVSEYKVNVMDAVWIVMTTFGDEAVAKRVVRELLERELVACGNVLPGVSSLYCWKGELCEENEVVVFLKTTAGKYGELERVLGGLHPYDEPEIVALPVEAGSEGYLAFVRNAVK